RKRFAAILLSAQMTALAVPATGILAATEADPTDKTREMVDEAEGISDTENPGVPGNADQTKPAAPADDPTHTQEPSEPAEPIEPVQPAEPEKPDQPASPEPEPSQPQKPDVPQTPQEPSVPEKPAAPAAPAAPQSPVTAAPKEEAPKPAAPAVQPAVAYKSVETKDLNVSIADKGYTGNLKKAMKLDDFKTANLEGFLGNGNPFMVGQCTWFAWARFYQVYGFDSGARGNGKTNAREIVAAHGDKFELSSTPAAGATFSMEKNTLYPQYGHVGFIEAFDGEFIWVSEGNVMFNDRGGNIWVHKVRWADFKASYPDVVFAIPKKGVCDLEDPQEPAQRTIRLKTKKTEKDPGEKTEKTVRRIVLKRPAKAAE
ncbi:CHAP domain-containing protein, partial [uncultured Dubosiella sp.]